MPAIETRALRKVYAAAGPNGGVVALQGLDLQIQDGEFFGLLGPNGAGKTTTIGILTTRVKPTSGTALVGGANVDRQAVQVRQRIGVVPQRPNPDRSLNAIENLIFHKAQAKVDEMSGGQQQRLMIARALIHEPQVIFLDEPTVGLDPQTRLALWDILRSLHAERRTIVMTTHYMEEADKLCDRIAIVDRGELLELDTPQALKQRAPGGTLIELTLGGEVDGVVDAVRVVEGVLRAETQGQLLRVYSDRGGRVISPVIQAAEDRGVNVTNISLTEPSLETLFVARTGRKLE
jgi:ABC-2 type transport system ATP-binding protein